MGEPVSMGYTHYWNDVSAEVVKKSIALCRPMIEDACKKGIIGDAQGMPETTPYVSEDIPTIVFNGLSPDDYETFALTPCTFGFCKTNQMPYDDIVVAVLTIAAHYGAKVSTDGDQEDWETGIRIAQSWSGETLDLKNITFFDD